MKLSKAFWYLITHLEGLKLQRYKDSAGKDTIGVGHLIINGVDNILTNVTGITNPDDVLNITEDQAYEILSQDSAIRVVAIMNILGQFIKTQNVLDSLLSFTYNVGARWLTKNEELIQAIKDANYDKAGNIMLKFVYAANTYNKGLYIRRLKEVAILKGRIDSLSPNDKLNASNIQDILLTINTYFGILHHESTNLPIENKE